MVLAADTPQDSRSYEVLYYKRTNKVHKAKGVAKFDGILQVSPPPSYVVLLLDEDGANKPVFSGIQREISKRAFGINESPTLQDDDVVALGQYECQIVSLLFSTTQDTSSIASVAKPVQMRRPMMPLQSKKRPLVAQKRPTTTLARPPVKPVTSKPGWQKTRNPPSQPKRSVDESGSDEDGDTVPSRPIMPKNPLMAKRHKLTTVTKGTASLSSAAAITTSTDFPGAIGNVVVPPSVCRVLRPHQTEGIAFLWNCLTGASPHLLRAAASSGVEPVAGVILADEMGLGKTLMTIATLFALHRRQKDKRFVVVCPSSLVSNWAKEFDKWIGGASQPKRVVVRKGGEQGLQTIRAFIPVKPNQSEVLIISYDLFRMNATILNQAKQVGLLVVDEGHRLKNSTGSLTLTALTGLKSDARLLITGTPIQNNLTEFHTVANFVCPGLLGDLSSFRKVYERPISAANSKSAKLEQRACGHAQSQALDKITKTFMLRRLQKDILKTLLPPRQELLLFCRPSRRQCELYKAVADSAMSSGVTAEALTVLTNLRKLCCHPSLMEKSNQGVNDIALSGKLQVLDALLQAIKHSNPGDKVVIVSNFTTVLSIIERIIFKARKWQYLRLDGTVSQSDRQPLVDSFNRCSPDKAFAFLLSSKAGGCGLNLIGANRLVMFDADFNPATDMQAMARIYRQGQTKPCFVYRMFTAGTVEEVVYQRQIQKGNLATITVDGSSSTDSSSARFTKEELKDCFTLKEDCDCDTKRKIGKRWPEYGGAEGLMAQGCDDAPLLSMANDQSETLSFVHVVTDEEIVVPDSKDMSEQTGDASRQEPSDEECEFVDDGNDSIDDETDNLSEEECEFDE